MPLLGERGEVTMLFQDIRDFTGISEKMAPKELVGMLNQFSPKSWRQWKPQGGS